MYGFKFIHKFICMVFIIQMLIIRKFRDTITGVQTNKIEEN